MPVRRRQIRTVVERLLLSNQIQSAPVDVEQLALVAGAEVNYEPGEENLCGFLLRDRQHRRAVIGVNSTHHPNRQRFTIAHELGHFLLHDGDDLHVDRSERAFLVRLRNEESSKGEDDDEKEANLFAAEILMPAIFLKQDLEELDGVDILDEEVLKPLAHKYQVSTQALTFRLGYLGYVQL